MLSGSNSTSFFPSFPCPFLSYFGTLSITEIIRKTDFVLSQQHNNFSEDYVDSYQDYLRRLQGIHYEIKSKLERIRHPIEVIETEKKIFSNILPYFQSSCL